MSTSMPLGPLDNNNIYPFGPGTLQTIVIVMAPSNELFIVGMSRPSQLQNCTLINQTSNSIQVDCTDGFDGGLPQSFLMQVLELPSLRPRLNLTSYRSPPTFTAVGLDGGASYRLALYAVNAKGMSDPTLIDPVTFKGVAKLQGTTAAMPVSPLLMALLATAALLATGVCLVLAALCRRHHCRPQGRPCPRPADNGTKHLPLEAALVTADDGAADGSVTGVGTPLSPADSQRRLMVVEARLPRGAVEGGDPDIIRNQYERRPIHGFMKMYEPPGAREEDNLMEDEGEEYDFRNVAKERTHVPSNHNIYRSLQRPSRATVGIPSMPSMPSSQTLTHKYRGPEVVTTSNRIQESCI
ncbi:unnamed protein product [Phaedon cochleariae]|uniref:Fibronectin type-III domain-containing protein n=1 Tax=Phaedon cochleariae TaxID=80249 RepID=A0A9N9SB15_PHACE|nr:unnamed protein product [Phaedon cochleariae]